jgi:hypothetical protein
MGCRESVLFLSEGPCYGLRRQHHQEIAKERIVKKWIIAAGIVAAGVAAVIIVTKPWPHGGGQALTTEEEAKLAALEKVNEKAKEASLRLKELRSKMKPFDAKTQPKPYPVNEAAAKEDAERLEAGHNHAHKERDPADLAKHEKANDVVTVSPIGLRPEPPVRADAKPRWDAVVKLNWDRLSTLFTGFSIGYKMGGDFTPDVLRDLHGAAVEVEGSMLPIDPPKGAMKRFWLVRPGIVKEQCAFCTAPSPGNLIYVDASKRPLPLSADERKKMYTEDLTVTLIGRFLLGPKAAEGGVEYLYGLELKEVK